MSFIAPKDVKATTVANTTTLAPKVGFAYDLFGDNRTVIKGFIGQSRWNSAVSLHAGRFEGFNVFSDGH